MHSLLMNSLMILPAIALSFGLFVHFGNVPLRGTLYGAWIIGTLATWIVAVALAASVIKCRAWLFSPLGTLSVAGTLAAGLGAFIQGSVALFAIFLVLTFAASIVALGESGSGARYHQLFSLAFAICLWLGLAFTFMARAPITDTPIVKIMWWAVTEWDNALGFNGASYLGTFFLLLTWLFAFTGAWLVSQFSARTGAGEGDARRV